MKSNNFTILKIKLDIYIYIKLIEKMEVDINFKPACCLHKIATPNPFSNLYLSNLNREGVTLTFVSG